MTTYIKTEKLVKNFGKFRAVSNISLSVPKGEVLGFLGPNGAGKSTTMRMITGYLKPTSGTVSICGYDVGANGLEAKSHLGYLPEGAPLYPDISPRLFLEFVGRAKAMGNIRIRERFDYVVDILNLELVLDQAIDTLSKGFKRRVGLAQAILNDPDVLILDEPTDGLDPIQKHEVRNLIKEMAKDKAIIISTHILEEIEAVCNRAVIIGKGSILADGTPELLLAKHKYHNALSMELEGVNIEDAKTSIASLDDVMDVETGKVNGTVTLKVIPKKNTDIMPRLHHLVYQKKWNLRSLSVERGKLDEIFREIAG